MSLSSPPRSFRFGVQLAGAGEGPAWRALARRAESLGYSTLFVPDHFDNQWSPLVAMTVAAEATTSLTVGALVLANDYRHPVVLAREIATLDRASQGRVELGIGAGWLRSDYEAAGIPYEPAGVRVERLAEALHIMKDLWSTGYSSRHGKHYRVEGVRGLPQPYTTPHPPVIIGGGGKSILSLAAREAGIVGVNASFPSGRVTPDVMASMSAQAFAQRVRWVRDAAGDRMAALELQCMATVCRITTERGETLERLFAGAVPAEVAGRMPMVLVGTVEEIADTLEERRAEYGFSYWVVRGAAEMEAFAPVVARLAGR